MRIFALTTLALLASLPSTAADHGNLRQASELVKTLRLDELNLLQFRGAILGPGNKTPLTTNARRCYESLTVADFNRLLAPLFARDFSAEQLTAANDFWLSPVGAKFLQMAYLKNSEMDPVRFPLHVDGAKQSVNYAELKVIVSYRESVDERLAMPFNYLDSDPIRVELATFILQTRMRCEEIR